MLEDQDHARVQEFLRICLDRIAARGFDFRVDPDLSGWAAHMRTAPGISAVNPTFDPDVCRLDRSNGFWIKLVGDGGRIVACHAARLFVTPDFREEIVSERLWHDKGLRALGRVELALPADMEVLSGRVVHEGGAWVHPDHRARGYAATMVAVLRALALRQWACDWFNGICLEKIARSGVVFNTYHFTRMVPCTTGWCPPVGRDAPLWMPYMSRAECLAQIARWIDEERNDALDLAVFEDRHEKTVVRMPVVAGEDVVGGRRARQRNGVEM